jgi:hypothetical protein
MARKRGKDHMTDALLTSHLDWDEDLLGLLAIPVEFVKYDDLDDVTLRILYTWKDAATQALKQLETRLLRGDAKVINDRPLEERAVIAAIAAQFLFEDPWTNDRVKEYATGMILVCYHAVCHTHRGRCSNTTRVGRERILSE